MKLFVNISLYNEYLNKYKDKYLMIVYGKISVMWSC
jgi:hypothetical protein